MELEPKVSEPGWALTVQIGGSRSPHRKRTPKGELDDAGVMQSGRTAWQEPRIALDHALAGVSLARAPRSA